MQIRISDERNEQVRRLLRLVGREPFQKRSWAELGFFLTSSVLAYVAAVTMAAFGAAGLLLSVVLVGVAVLACGLRLARGFGRWQRTLAAVVLGEDIAEPEPFHPRPGLFGWLRGSLGDRTAWRAVGYFVAKVPLTIFGLWFAFGIWVEALFGIASPLTGHSGPARFGPFGELFGYNSNDGPLGVVGHVVVFVTGAMLLFIAPWTMRLVVTLDRWMMQVLLGPDAAASRVRSLEQSRSKTLDVATETLQRIERNLHDGTQASW